MRIPSTAGTRDPERSRFFHKLLDGHTSLPNDFDELGLFALLKAKFGPPNGFLTFLGKPGGDPDGPFKWDYLFCPEGALHLQIIRGVNGIEALWWNGRATGAEIVSYLVANLDRYSTRIKKAIAELEHYTLILNPFVRHKTVVDAALRDLDKIHSKPPVFPSSQKTTKQELDRFSKQYKTFMANVDTQASLTMLVVLESAFMAEAALIEPKVRKEFEFAAESNPLGFNETKGIYGVPFGQAVFVFSGGM